MLSFAADSVLPASLFAAVTDTRVSHPRVPREEANQRLRRPHLTTDGRLVLVAADHPARLVLGVGDQHQRMADRRDYLARVLRILQEPAVDGVLATPDVVDDLLIIRRLWREQGRPGLLDHKVMIGSMNRGGLADSVFELNDPVTAYTPEALRVMGLDGGKLLYRLALSDPDCLSTALACVKSISRLGRLDLPVFLEALPVARSAAGRWQVTLTAEALVQVVSVAQALGWTTAQTWLKLPLVSGFAQVAASSTMPVLLLGGHVTGDLLPFLAAIAGTVAEAASVRGLLVGRNLLYPGDEDPLVAARAAAAVVRGTPAATALERARREPVPAAPFA